MANPFGKYGDILIKGLVSQAAPGITQGALVEMLKNKKVDVKKASQWVQENRSLWNELDPGEQEGMRRLADSVSDLSWMTTEWAINAMRKELPAVASLFLGWTKAHNWLERQIEIFREEIKP